MSDSRLQRQILAELDDGPKGFEELKEMLFGCDKCGRYDSEDDSKFCEAWNELYQDNRVHLTVDRRLAAGPPTGIR